MLVAAVLGSQGASLIAAIVNIVFFADNWKNKDFFVGMASKVC